MGKLRVLKPGNWLRNLESWAFPASVTVAVETDAPLELISSRRTVAVLDDIFVIAMPDSTVVEASTYTRNAFEGSAAATPAWVTRMPDFVYENTREPAGATLFCAGRI